MVHGWRARIGMILPMDNAVLEPEIAALGLGGVSTHVARLATKTREEMPTSGVALSEVFNELEVDAVGYACAETSFIGGQDTNHTVRDGITRATGRPAVTAIGAMVEALEALGAHRPAIVAPYRQASVEALRGYVDQAGLDIAGLVAHDFAQDSSDPREWYETNRQPPSTAYRLARAADTAEADVVTIFATNLRTFEVLAPLEADLGKPVVSSNSALLWALLRRCGVATDDDRLGRLWNGAH